MVYRIPQIQNYFLNPMPNEPDSSAQNQLFKALQREPTLSERVTDQIEGLIIQSQLQPGDRLPPERELAQQFGVSRTVIREAIRTLSAKGMLEVQAGGGTVVSSPSAEAVAQSMNLYLRGSQPRIDYSKVHEIRYLLEVEIAGLAAKRRTNEDLARMEQILQEAAETGQTNREIFAKTDVAFHSALAQATHNDLFGLILDSLADIMFEIRLSGFNVPGTVASSLLNHRAIFEKVQAGDEEGAREAMRQHMIESVEIQRKALALQTGPEQL